MCLLFAVFCWKVTFMALAKNKIAYSKQCISVYYHQEANSNPGEKVRVNSRTRCNYAIVRVITSNAVKIRTRVFTHHNLVKDEIPCEAARIQSTQSYSN